MTKGLVAFTALLLITVPAARGQNLVINPGFETITSCPIGPSELSKAAPWRDPFQNLVGDTCSTSDLYNSCNMLGGFGVGVPANVLGNQAAYAGNGYAGIIVYEGVSLFGCLSLFGTGWREYLEGTLTTPLVAGETYCISFQVSLADNAKYASDDLAVYLSPTLVNVSCATVGNASNLPFTPQLNYSGPNITTTSGWQEVSWDYTATGGEQYIIIGNFKNDANTSYECVNASTLFSYAYYYIDEVSVRPGSCSQVPCELVAQVHDQGDASCSNGADGYATVSVTGGTGPYTFVWQPGGATGAVQTGLAGGTYTVTITDQEGCSTVLPVQIGAPPPLQALVSTTPTPCGEAGGSATVTVSGGTGPYALAWSPGSATTATVNGLASGAYSVSVTDANGCTVTATAQVVPQLPIVTIAGPALLCAGESITLSATGADAYLWNTGATTASIVVNTAGVYSVTGTNTCGTATAATSVEWAPEPVASISGDTVLCSGEQLVLTASGGGSYLWNTGATTASITVLSGGTYSVTVTNCGTATAGVTVTEVTVVAAFSPASISGNAPLAVEFINGTVPGTAASAWDLGNGSTSGAWSPSTVYTDPGVYTVVLVASLGDCSSTTTGTVIVTGPVVDSDLWVPNIFTPNGDGGNDTWGPVAQGLQRLEVVIYNRWGQVVGRLERPGQTWSGRSMAGEQVPEGTYFYVLKAAGVDGKDYDLQGAFTLVR
jgi:gliding motility-associated-like protein